MGLRQGFGGGSFTSHTLPPPKWRGKSIFIAPPTDLVGVEFSPTQIDLTWVDHSDNEDGFKIERAVDSGGWSLLWTTLADVQSYSDMTASAGHTFHYRVRAFKGSDFSTYSNTADVTISGGTSLLTPYNLYAQRWDSTEVNIFWQDDDLESALDGFKIERKSDSGSYAEIDTVPWSSNYVTPLGVRQFFYYDMTAAGTSGITYTYRVRAYKSTDNSNYSNEASITDVVTPITLYPNTPYLSITASDDTSITLGWNDVNGATVPSQYLNEDGTKIERSHNGGAFAYHDSVGSDVTSYVDTTDLVYGDLYAYRVIAFYHTYPGVPSTWTTDTNDSAPSNEVSTTLGTYVSPPLNLNVVVGSGLVGPPPLVELDLDWTYPIDQSTTPTIMGFELERCTDAVHYEWIATVGPAINYYPNKTFASTTANFDRSAVGGDVEVAMDDISWLFANDTLIVGNDTYGIKLRNKTLTTDNFIQPAISSVVTIPVVDTAWMTTNDIVKINDGSYTVGTINSSTSVDLTYDGGGIAEGNTIFSGTAVSKQSAILTFNGSLSTKTTINYVQPAVSANVTVQVADSLWMNVGDSIVIKGSTYTVSAVNSPISVDLTYDGGGPAEGQTIGLDSPIYKSSSLTSMTYVTSVDVVLPALDSNVTVQVADTSWMAQYDQVTIGDRLFTIADILGGTAIDVSYVSGTAPVLQATTTANFVQPAVFSTVTVSVADTSLLVSGTKVNIGDSVYAVGTIVLNTSVDLTWLSGGVDEGTVVSSGSQIYNGVIGIGSELYKSITVNSGTSVYETAGASTVIDGVYYYYRVRAVRYLPA